MKKLFITFACIAGIFASQVAMANPYKLDESAVDQKFAAATEISVDQLAVADVNAMSLAPNGDVTLGGFLLRSFFCGTFGIHRSYAGTKGLGFKYCITLGIINTVDFWYTVIKGQEGLDNFTGNPNFVVWTDKGRQ